MKTITAIAFIAMAVMLIAPDYESPSPPLTRDDKIRILCGDNAAWLETGKSGEIQCFTKRGHKTIKRVVP
jgi:hypothetical protein